MAFRRSISVLALLMGALSAAAAAQPPKSATPLAPVAPVAQAAPAPPQPERTVSTFGDWNLRCEARPTTPPTRQCEVATTSLDARQQPVLQLVIGTPQSGPRVLVLLLPVNVSLAAETRLVLDDKDKPVVVPLRSCTPRACTAELEFTDMLATRFRALGDGALHFEYKDAAQAPVSVPVSMKGFATAMDALARERS